MTLQHWTTNGNQKSWRKLTRRDQGSSEKMMDDEKSNDSWESIQKRPKLVSLGLTGPLLGQMDGWLGVFNDHHLCTDWILKMIIIGSGLFTNDIVNMKHQGAGQKLMIGWHKHQGVSETPKNADVICEQPLTTYLKKITDNGDTV